MAPNYNNKVAGFRKKTRKNILHSEYFLLLVLLCGAVALRLTYWANDTLCLRDSITYIAEVRNLKDLQPISSSEKIVYNYYLQILKIISFWDGDIEFCGALINIVLSSLTVVMTFFTIKELHIKSTASLLAALLVAVHPVLVRESHQILREPLYLFLCSCWSFFLLRGLNSRRAFLWLFFSGFFATTALFTRYEALELIPFSIAISICFIYFFDRTDCGKHLLQIWFFFAIGCMAGLIVSTALLGISGICVMYQRFLFLLLN